MTRRSQHDAPRGPAPDRIRIVDDRPPPEALGTWYADMPVGSPCVCRHVVGSHGSTTSRCTVDGCGCDGFHPGGRT